MTSKTDQRRAQHVVAYGADRKSTGTHMAIFFGAIAFLLITLFAVGFAGRTANVQANNPSAVIKGDTATVPGAGSAGEARPGGNWDRRLNR